MSVLYVLHIVQIVMNFIVKSIKQDLRPSAISKKLNQNMEAYINYLIKRVHFAHPFLISMQMRKIFTLLFVILIVSSCSESKKREIDYQKVLTSEIIKLEDLGLPMRIKIDSENRLIYIDHSMGSDQIKVYDLDTFKFINSFIKKGEGPNEQLLSYSIQLDVKNRLVYSTDPIKKRIYVYSMDSVMAGKSGFWPSFDIDLRKVGMEKPMVMQDGFLIDFRKSYRADDDFAYNLIDFNGVIIDTVGQYPKTQKEITPFQKSEAFVGYFNVSERQEFIIRSYLFSDRLEKLDFKGNVIKSYTGPLQMEPQFVTDDLGGGSSIIKPIKGSLTGFKGQAIIGEENIYVLFDGKEFYRDDEEGNLLFHFDTDLNLHEVIYLDQSIVSFDIDWVNKTLIGFSWNVEGGLVKYQLE